MHNDHWKNIDHKEIARITNRSFIQSPQHLPIFLDLFCSVEWLSASSHYLQLKCFCASTAACSRCLFFFAYFICMIRPFECITNQCKKEIHMHPLRLFLSFHSYLPQYIILASNILFQIILCIFLVFYMIILLLYTVFSLIYIYTIENYIDIWRNMNELVQWEESCTSEIMSRNNWTSKFCNLEIFIADLMRLSIPLSHLICILSPKTFPRLHLHFAIIFQYWHLCNISWANNQEDVC